ncbi:hypothetical protein BGZ76_000929, partial [Entomortierella beljakovae]
MSENDIRYSIPAKFLPAKIIAIKTSKGKSQSEGEELIQYEYTEQVEGFIDEGETSTHVRRKVVIDFEGCDHDTQYEGLCVVCYKSVPKNAKSHVNMTHDATSLSVSRNEAKRLEQDNVSRLLKEGKLSLIVDLDQTLIHATVGTAIEEWVNSQKEIPKDIRKFNLSDSPKPYYIKLRPHLTTFLEKVSALYELHIYTMGTRNYAAKVASVIDPDGKLFSQRILSRDENAGTGDINAGHLPKLEAQVKIEPAKAAILPEVNTSTKPSSTSEELASVSEATSETPELTTSTESEAKPSAESEAKPSAESEAKPSAESEAKPSAESEARPSTESVAVVQNIEGNKAPKPVSPVKDDNDIELERVLDLLETIHEQYYDALENYKQGTSTRKADVKPIIHSLKSEVLKGVHVVFSGVIPRHQVPERTDIWRQADSFGAHCYHDLDPRVTHVVAAQPGTEKVMKARRRKNIKIVRPEWLFNSITKWEKQDETQYLLQSVRGKASSNSTTPPMLTEGEETGAEDDDQGGISEGMDENHRPLSMNNEEINEHLKSVNWDDMEKEVEDLVGDIDESDFDSDTSARSNTQSDVSIEGSRSPLVSLKRARIPRKSGLGATVTYGSSDDEDDSDSIGNGLGMNEIGDDDDETMNSDGSDGDIDDESGSNSEGDESQGGSEIASDAESSKRPLKRRRIGGVNNKKAARAGRDSAEEDIDADDENTMDYSIANVESQGEGSDDEEEDDEAFLNFMESDIGAQLIEDQDEEDNGSHFSVSSGVQAPLAIVDMGSNGIRFGIIASLDRHLPVLYEERASISLFEAQFSADVDDMDADAFLSPRRKLAMGSPSKPGVTPSISNSATIAVLGRNDGDEYDENNGYDDEDDFNEDGDYSNEDRAAREALRRTLVASEDNEITVMGLGPIKNKSAPSERRPISEKVIDEVVRTFERWQALCHQSNVQAVRVIATEATRTAPNSEEFQARIKAATGWSVELLSKAQEANIGALGVMASYHTVQGLFMDLGGGSVQLNYIIRGPSDGHGKSSPNAQSWPYGAAALSRRINDCQDKGARQAIYEEMVEAFKHGLEDIDIAPEVREYNEREGGYRLYLSGGGFRALGYLLMSRKIKSNGTRYPLPIINGFIATGKELAKVVHEYRFLAPEDVQTCFRVSKRRAKLIPACATLMAAVMEVIQVKDVLFSEGGVRQGGCFGMLPLEIQNRDPTLEAVRSFVKAFGGGQPPLYDSDLQSLSSFVASALPSDFANCCRLSSSSTSGTDGGHAGLSPKDAAELKLFIESLPRLIPLLVLVMNCYNQLPKEARSTAAWQLFLPGGALASCYGLTHYDRAILATVLSERHDGDLADPDQGDAIKKMIPGGKIARQAVKYLGKILSLAGLCSPIPGTATLLFGSGGVPRHGGN